MNPSAEQMLPHVPPYPGQEWWDIVKAGPKNRRGHTMPFKHSIAPLVRAGLIAVNQRPRRSNGTLPPALYYVTAQGIETRKGGDAKTGPVRQHESPVAESDAPYLSPKDSS